MINEPILVTGMWHSGTRMLVNILELAGIDFGRNTCALGRKNNDFTDIKFSRLIQKIIINNIAEPTLLQRVMLRERLVKYFNFNHKWGIKLPIISYMIPYFNKLFPNSKIVGIIRDGRDVSLSSLGVGVPTDIPRLGDFENIFKYISFYSFSFQDWFFFNKLKRKLYDFDANLLEFENVNFKNIPYYKSKTPPKEHVFAAKLWLESTQRLIANRGNKQYFEISYERLCKRPEEIIPDLLDFLGVKENLRIKDMLAIPSCARIGKWKKVEKSKINEIISVASPLLNRLEYT